MGAPLTAPPASGDGWGCCGKPDAARVGWFPRGAAPSLLIVRPGYVRPALWSVVSARTCEAGKVSMWLLGSPGLSTPTGRRRWDAWSPSPGRFWIRRSLSAMASTPAGNCSGGVLRAGRHRQGRAGHSAHGGNTRLCTATAAAALKESFGADGQPGPTTSSTPTPSSCAATEWPRPRRCSGDGCWSAEWKATRPPVALTLEASRGLSVHPHGPVTALAERSCPAGDPPRPPC
jgi:hypothetical protein